MIDKQICKHCNGKGKAKLPNMDIMVNCPMCKGTGYEMNNKIDVASHNIVDDGNFQFNSNKEIKEETNQNFDLEASKEIILTQISKYPTLFTNGVDFKYEDENTEIFIYLKNNHIFNIIQTPDAMHVTIKNEFKNKLAEQTISFLTQK